MKKWLASAFAAFLLAAAPAWAQISGTLQNAATANGNGTTLRVLNAATVTFTVNCSGCSGGTQVNFEGTQNGSNFVAIAATPSNATASSFATSTTTAGITVWSLSVAGFQEVRARISAYSAGTVTVTGSVSPASVVAPSAPYIGAISGGAATPLIACTQVVQGTNSGSGNVRIITGVGSKLTRICSWHIEMGTVATGWSLTAGTGTNCNTSTVTILSSSAVLLAAGGEEAAPYEFYHGINAQVNANDVCLNLSANNPMKYTIFYDQE